jgi:hypothetical protein
MTRRGGPRAVVIAGWHARGWAIAVTILYAWLAVYGAGQRDRNWDKNIPALPPT